MKAAVICQRGEMAHYTDFPEPVVYNESEILISVKAVAIKQVDKSKASGKPYPLSSASIFTLNTFKVAVAGSSVSRWP
jgi:hypothetical protein